MGKGFGGSDAAARGASKEAKLDEVRLVDILDGLALLARRRSDCLDTDGTAGEFFDHHREDVSVSWLEAEVVHLKEVEGFLGDAFIDHLNVFCLRIVTDTFQETVCNAGCAAARLGNFFGTGSVDADIEDAA